MTDFASLAEVTKLAALKAEQELLELRERENDLRSQLTALETRRRNSGAKDLGQLPMQAVGADILWQRWVDRQRAELNTYLARVLAEKESKMPRIRRALGRKSVAEEIVNRAAFSIRDQNAKRDQETLLELLVLQSSKE